MTRYIQVTDPRGAYAFLSDAHIKSISAGTVGNTKITTHSGRMYFRDEPHEAVQDAFDGAFDEHALMVGQLECSNKGCGSHSGYHWRLKPWPIVVGTYAELCKGPSFAESNVGKRLGYALFFIFLCMLLAGVKVSAVMLLVLLFSSTLSPQPGWLLDLLLYAVATFSIGVLVWFYHRPKKKRAEASKDLFGEPFENQPLLAESCETNDN